MSTNGGAARYPLFRSFAPALVLLGVAVVLNYVDRGNLSIAAPLVEAELRLSPVQLGFLFSAFFYTYTALQFVIGGVVDRFGANLVLSIGLALWSLATIATGFAGGFVGLLALRLLLGVGESVAFPCSSKLIAQNVRPEDRGLANAVITAGLKLGPAVGAFGAGLLIAKYGWRPVFWGLGLASLLWLPAWWFWKPPETREPDPAQDSWRISRLQIFREGSFWGCAAGHFSFNYISYFFLTWLPLYLSHERHLSQEAIARAAGAYYLTESASALAAGFASDLAVRHGGGQALIRKALSAIGHAVAAIGILGCAFSAVSSYYPWLLLAGVGSGAAACGVFLFGQTIAGPRVAGQWAGLQNGFGNFAGLIGPTLTGFLVSHTGNFLSAFTVAAAISLAGVFLWIFAVRLVPAQWATRQES